MGPVQVSVRYQDFGVSVRNFLDNGGNRIIQLCGDHMAALARQDFQCALVTDPGQNGVLHTVQQWGW